ncbi:hypothetical protein LH464_24200, partial [Neorhizobium sp. T786]|nr:hypothetical protein [Neorhizobium xiangyangii]
TIGTIIPSDKVGLKIIAALRKNGSDEIVEAVERAASKPIIPQVVDPKLENYVNNVFKGVTNPNKVGSGTLGDAVRYELASGENVHGRSHVIKAEETIRGLQNWIKNTPAALAVDRQVAEAIIADLQNALNGK